jgi:hypothetical protein
VVILAQLERYLIHGLSKKVNDSRSASIQGLSPESQAPSDPLKGSYEGYMNSSPAYIQANGAGYDNPTNQQARYNKKSFFLTGDSLAFNNSNNIKNSAIIDNYSSTLKRNSSGDRLLQMRKIEGMFR